MAGTVDAQMLHLKDFLKKEPFRSIWIAALFEMKFKKEQIHQTNISRAIVNAVSTSDTAIVRCLQDKRILDPSYFFDKTFVLNNLTVNSFFRKKESVGRDFHCKFNCNPFKDKIMGAEDTVLSYRIISHLLLGIVRIYSKKVEYLKYDSDCLLSKLQQFGRCRGSTNAMFGPPSIITIPKQLQLDAFSLDIVAEESRDYISNIEDITIQEQTEEIELHLRDQLYCLDDDASGSGYLLPDPILVKAVCFPDTVTVDARLSRSDNDNTNMETYLSEDFLPYDEADEQDRIDEDVIESPNCINGTPTSKVPHVAGAATPMVAVQTPTTKEGVIVKKPKCIWDEPVKIPSESYKEQLADWSDLKRVRKTPCSAKRLYPANQICHKNLFSIPVIPCSSLNNVFSLSDKLPKNTKQVECLVTPANSFAENDASMTDDHEFDTNLVNEELNSSEEDIQENHEHWSVRTRSVASLLHENFRSIKYKEEDEDLKMSHISAGKIARESAILFYELLVLKTGGYVNVKQDDAYGDISVSETDKLKELNL